MFVVEGVLCVCMCCSMNEDSVLGRMIFGRWVVIVVILIRLMKGLCDATDLSFDKMVKSPQNLIKVLESMI